MVIEIVFLLSIISNGLIISYGFIIAKPLIRSSAMKTYGLFDSFSNILKNAFENDAEYSEKDDPGITKRANKEFYGRRVFDKNLLDSGWRLKVALTGIPLNDPSSDLYAPKQRPGKIDGIELQFNVTLLADGVIAVSENDFTVSGAPGKWKLDKDGTTLAFSFACEGFTRTIKTQGSILNVYGGEGSARTSSEYMIPGGSCLVQCGVIMNDSGRVIIKDGKLFGKDPRDVGRGQWSQAS